MSIEALLQAHIDALKANTEAVNYLAKSLYGRTAGGENDSPKVGKKTAEKVEAKEDPKPEVVEEKKDDPVDSKKSDVAVEETVANLSYETARALVLKLANAGKREAIPKVFKSHGIDNLKKLLDKEDDFTSVNDQAKLEAVYADLQALEG